MRESLKIKVGCIIIFTASLFFQSCKTESTDEVESKTAIAPAVVIAGADAAVKSAAAIFKIFNELVKRAEQKAKDQKNATSFLQATAGDLHHMFNIIASKKKIRPYNVAMCDASQRCELKAEEGEHYFRESIGFKDKIYTVWAFRAGTFTNPGKGGFDNWILLGCHDHKSGQGARAVRFQNTGWIGNNPADAKPGCL